MQLLEDEPELTEKLGEVPVAVIEKGKTTGAHLLSGANMRPSAMTELFPDLDPSDWPVYQEVTKDAVYFLTSNRSPFRSSRCRRTSVKTHGNYVTSIAKLGRVLGEKAEEAGVYILSETAADKLLVSERIVRGHPLRRQGPRQGGGGALQLRAGVRRGRQGDGSRRGHPRPPDRRRARLLRPPWGPYLERWELGVKEVLGGREALSTGSSTPWAGHCAGDPSGRRRAAASSTRWGRTRSASAWSSGWTRATLRSRPTTPCRS